MENRQTLITLSIIVSFSISILISYFVTNSNNNKLQTTGVCNVNCNNNSHIQSFLDSINLTRDVIGSTVDAKYDTHLTTLYKATQMPEIHGFYDIVSTQVSKMHNDILIFTINLDDDPNKNKKYETTYLWLVSQRDLLNDEIRIYTIIIPNFGIESNFKNKGWYLAIYDNINNEYSLPLSRIDQMTDNKVEIAIDPIFIGNILTFNYTTAVMIRINDTFLDKQPDYLIDSSPNDDAFWSKWFV
jgi:hypothetical protein